MASIEQLRSRLSEGLVIPACPLALNARRKLDERRQRALFRYYLAAGAGGLAVGVHTTQFAIRDPKIGLFRPVLELAAEELLLNQPSEGRHSCRPALKAAAIGMSPLRTSGSQPASRSERTKALSRSAAVPGRSAHETANGVSLVPRSATHAIAAAGDGRAPATIAIGGICGQTRQAMTEATLIRELGFHAGLLSLGALKTASEDELIAHCRTVSEVVPLVGFYLQPAAGGRVLPYSFWRRLAEVENVVAIKIAPFNRYQTLDVIRALAEAGRDDIALYTGNDDNIVMDLLTPFRFRAGRRTVERRIVGGLLGHWAVWTRNAVELHAECRRLAKTGGAIPVELLRRAVEVTDANAAFFDAANGYAGCIAGLHEVLRRQGLLEGIWCLDPNETLSPGQREEIDRVCRAYPHLNDDEFVARHREEWMHARTKG